MDLSEEMRFILRRKWLEMNPTRLLEDKKNESEKTAQSRKGEVRR